MRLWDYDFLDDEIPPADDVRIALAAARTISFVLYNGEGALALAAYALPFDGFYDQLGVFKACALDNYGVNIFHIFVYYHIQIPDFQNYRDDLIKSVFVSKVFKGPEHLTNYAYFVHVPTSF